MRLFDGFNDVLRWRIDLVLGFSVGVEVMDNGLDKALSRYERVPDQIEEDEDSKDRVLWLITKIHYAVEADNKLEAQKLLKEVQDLIKFNMENM